MASKELNVKLKQRYDTASNWTTNNPVLLAGELGIESDTNKMKVGDGSSSWNLLEYIASEPDAYIKTAEVSDDVLIITRQDDSSFEFKGGGGTKIIWRKLT